MPALLQQGLRHQALARGEALERREPVAIVILAGVGLAAAAHFADHFRERRRPFLPGEEAALVQRQRHRERLRFPRRVEDRLRGARIVVHSRYGSQRSA